MTRELLDIEDVKVKLKKRNQVLFTRDSKCLQELLVEIRKYPHRVLAIFSLECAKVPATLLKEKTNNDPRLDLALDLCTKWMKGYVKMPVAKRALLDVHAIAKETNDKYVIALAHAIGQACGSVHVETHTIGLVMYELTSIVVKYGIENCEPYLYEKLEYYKSMLVECDKRCKGDTLEWAKFLKKDDPENKGMVLYKKSIQK